MASVQWSDLSGDILSIIVKLLNSDVDLIRLRSVCSSWRSSLPSRMRRYSFPMKVPPILFNSIPSPADNKQLTLEYTTIYRLSPSDRDGDSSDGWLLRVQEVKPNTFTLLCPMIPEKIDIYPRILNHIDLLKHRISEICKGYRISGTGSLAASGFIVRKVIVLWDFFDGCEFAVLILIADVKGLHRYNDGLMRYWKFGDENWTPIDIGTIEFEDVIYHDGKFYAVSNDKIICFDSKFKRSFVIEGIVDLRGNYRTLAVHKAELYVLVFFEGIDELNEYEVNIFGIRDCGTYIKNLENDEFFLSSIDMSFGLSTKDFRDLKGNCVYMGHRRILPYECSIGHNIFYGWYQRQTIDQLKMKARGKIYWPPPKWLIDGATSS